VFQSGSRSGSRSLIATTRWGMTAFAVAATMCCSYGSSASGAAEVAHQDAATRVQSATSGFSGAKWGDPAADKLAKNAYGKNAAQQDPGSLYTVDTAIGARKVWGRKDSLGRHDTGQGVGVALLDSGVDQVAGLDAAGKVTYGPDLSIEGNGPLTQQDTFGHGTFMAGIIAGRGTTNPSSDLGSAPAQIQLGVAPDAKLLAIKLATTDGSTDVSQVIAALDWVTEHPVMPDGTRIRVINLSYGTSSAQSYAADPLAAAAENAWRHGIVVVTSAGNDGTATGRLTDPAIDPYVLAVGATDSGDTTNGWQGGHATAAAFTSVGSAARRPDLSAPGTSIVSARDTGSYIDVNHPEGLVAGDTSGTLFRGSGTSQAAAVVSGAVADLLQAYPTLTPDQVKFVLTHSAQVMKAADPNAVGAGTLDLAGAYDMASHVVVGDNTAAALRSASVQTFAQSTGQGSIDAARGDSVLVDADGDALTGEIDVQGNPWDPAAWWQASSGLTAWSGGDFLGVEWTGAGWSTTGDDTTSARWSSARWSSARWSDADWTSARWSSARWSSARWSSARWSSARWSSNDW
jgi:serine protease AprX